MLCLALVSIYHVFLYLFLFYSYLCFALIFVAFAILHILNDITENIKSGTKSTIGKIYKKVLT
jgi:hypothetical protein